MCQCVCVCVRARARVCACVSCVYCVCIIERVLIGFVAEPMTARLEEEESKRREVGRRECV